METKSISKIFNQAIFRVPDYQRGYSWSKKQLEQFWDDIERLRDDQEHYVGLLTIEEARDIDKNNKWDDVKWIIDSSDYKPFYIVDGQQRLTTIVILLQAIIEKTEDGQKLNLQSKEHIIEQFICMKNENLKAFIFGYEKDDPSYEFLKTAIFNEQSSSSINTSLSLYTQNLSGAKDFFDVKLGGYGKDELEDLYRKVALRLKFNLYEVDNDLDVFVMFETMNNRGKPLSRLELMKNRLIYLSTLLDNSDDEKTEIRNQINNSWKTIYEYLGKDKKTVLDDDEFLKNHTYMYFGYMDETSTRYAEYLLDEYFTAPNVYRGSISLKVLGQYVENIQKSIVKWFDIKFPENNNSTLRSDIQHWLAKLNRLKSAYFLPSIMAALLPDSQGRNHSKEQILRLLEAMEKFAFLSFSVYRRNSNYRKNYFLSQAKDICHGRKSISDLILSIEDAITQKRSFLDDFHDRIEKLFDNDKQPGFYGWNGLHYLLFEYELYLQNDEEIKVSWSTAKQTSSLEHIFPQTPNEDWQRGFQGVTDRERKLLCHSLGNLLLISQKKNSSLCNKGFSFKKNHSNGDSSCGYFNGSHSEIAVAQYSIWTANEILDRGLKILDFIEQRWGIQFSSLSDKKKILFLDFIVD